VLTFGENVCNFISRYFFFLVNLFIDLFFNLSIHVGEGGGQDVSKIGFGLQSYWTFRYRDVAGNLIIIRTLELLVLTQEVGILRRNAFVISVNLAVHILYAIISHELFEEFG